ncbi:hypothetical protein SPOG_04897 [Schizosaccharomyces cryophilus OY26]|uniref:Gag1-like clamp domain-containing protein n=1 Tax=Schizosaccharomyces cryophilus (strain OY26 / ATCC MYA-4695 / CBS 11777 / NBRC 106824 / NRRL Y48691) TaxID=653667 RepID=S9VXS5_SCHCR|nr:uncharacterized protein SPOG_04897 [Schizosaccharomyces cryophilus OY26]EPY51014.1 hypothetical protein SPOG_04897 [Schizosaccharomyces cryophilus OY26]
MQETRNMQDWEVGVNEWYKRRSAWLLDHDKLTNEHSSNEVVISKDVYLNVYKMLVHQEQKLKRPVKLSSIVGVLKAGWVEEGFWPATSK